MKKTVLILWLLVLAISCKNDPKEARLLPDQVQQSAASVPTDDSMFITKAIFAASEFNQPLQKVTKYQSTGISDTVTSKTAIHFPGYKQNFHELVAYRGEKYSLQLANGNDILLNSGSNLIFHPLLGNYLEINGEGYFKIEDHTKILVDYKITVVTDIGTIVNITAYDDSTKKKKITVALVKGNAEVTDGKANATLTKPGSKVVFDIRRKTLLKGQCELEDVLAWTKNEFHYDDINYYDLLQRICRWYDLELEYPADLPRHNWGFGGNFKEPVQQIIERLNNSSMDTKCRIEGKKLIVSRK